jgi:membrane protein YdbS with pleckstrin-like domain
MINLNHMDGFEIEPNESVTLVVRKHWVLLALRLLPDVFLAIAPPIFIFIFSGIPTPPERFFLGVWWLLIWMGAFGHLTRYFLNAWIITTTRIIDINQPAFFRRTISSFLLDRVQDITSDVDGIIETAVGFGTLSVETAGRDEHFQMCGVPQPDAIRDLIMREVAELHDGGAASFHSDGV